LAPFRGRGGPSSSLFGSKQGEFLGWGSLTVPLVPIFARACYLFDFELFPATLSELSLCLDMPVPPIFPSFYFWLRELFPARHHAQVIRRSLDIFVRTQVEALQQHPLTPNPRINPFQRTWPSDKASPPQSPPRLTFRRCR